MLPCKLADLVAITWRDAVATRITDEDHEYELATNTNIGWIVRETRRVVVLAHGISDTGEIDVFKIPRNCILGRQYFSRRNK